MKTLSSTVSFGVMRSGSPPIAALLLEMEQAGVVLFVGPAAQVAHEAEVNIGPLAQLQELLVRFEPPVFRHAEEHHAIDRGLHGGVQVVRRNALVPQGDVSGQERPASPRSPSETPRQLPMCRASVSTLRTGRNAPDQTALAGK